MAPAFIILLLGLYGLGPTVPALHVLDRSVEKTIGHLENTVSKCARPTFWSGLYPTASVGRAGNGRLLFGHQIRNARGLHVLVPRNSWSTPEVQWRLDRLAAHVLDTHQTAPDLVVLDISREHGGTFPPHRGHQDGADVDLRLYLKGVKSGDHRRRHIAAHLVDISRLWTLIEWIHDHDAAERIFLDVGLQRRLYRHARRVMKRRPAQIAPILSYPKSRWVDEALVKHVSGHAHHIHVRFRTPLAKMAGQFWTTREALRLQQAQALRRRGAFDHVVKRGDTLSALATNYGVGVHDIKRWNPRIRSRSLRPGQVLRFAGPRKSPKGLNP